MTRLSALAACSFLTALALAPAGCGTQPYPVQLTYPLRSDRLVGKLPDLAPDGAPASGKLEEFIASLDSRGGKTYDPADLGSEQKEALLRVLNETFGSPANPLVQGSDESDRDLIEQLQLDPERLAAGSKLYRTYCLQCHGLTGDGRGPTGQWVYPFPRDLRQGVFKYVSSAGSAARKLTRADMRRILKNGIERTSMPPFAALSDQQCDQIIAYTIHLSLRGEVEYRAMLGMLADTDDRDDDVAAEVRSRLTAALKQWLQADRDVMVPAAIPASKGPDEKLTAQHQATIRRGYELFTNQANGCISCHADYGRQAKYLYDIWGGAAKVADLTEGTYRGGKTPLDVFCRIRGGIGAAGMPAATSLTEDQVWDLTHFVLALPYPAILPPDIREKVHPAPR